MSDMDDFAAFGCDARERRPDGSMTIAEWCGHRRLSRSMAYKLWSEGRGPATYFVGSKRFVSAEADAAWLRAREAESSAA
jgi:hypothetical protein